MVKPLLVLSKYLLDWVVDKALLGGTAWLLGGIATFAGALLQRWQSGNIRSYAAWLAAGAAAVLIFVVVPWSAVLASLRQFISSAWRGSENDERINNSILTLILLVPLAGAVLVMLVPDRGKLPNWIALLTSLATFGLTLHLPAHFDLSQGGFQFVINRAWIEKPAIFYHVGVDGLSLWLVVLAGLAGACGRAGQLECNH